MSYDVNTDMLRGLSAGFQDAGDTLDALSRMRLGRVEEKLRRCMRDADRGAQRGLLESLHVVERRMRGEASSSRALAQALYDIAAAYEQAERTSSNAIPSLGGEGLTNPGTPMHAHPGTHGPAAHHVPQPAPGWPAHVPMGHGGGWGPAPYGPVTISPEVYRLVRQLLSLIGR